LLPSNFHRKISTAGPAYDQLSFLIYAEQFLTPQSEDIYSNIKSYILLFTIDCSRTEIAGERGKKIERKIL